jgi:hypothetical protein
MFYNLASTQSKSSDEVDIYMAVRYNVAIPGWSSRAQKNVANGETHATNISQASLGWKPRSPGEQNLPAAHSASPCISHVYDHWLLPLLKQCLLRIVKTHAN